MNTNLPIAAILFTDPGATTHAFAEMVMFQDGSFQVVRVWYDVHNRSKLANALLRMQREYTSRGIPARFVIEVIVGVIYEGRDPSQVFATIENQGRMKDASEAQGFGFFEKPAPEWRKQFFGYSSPSDDETRLAVETIFRNKTTKQLELPDMLSNEREHIYDAIIGGIVCLLEMTRRSTVMPPNVATIVAEERLKTKMERQAKRALKEMKGEGGKEERRRPTRAKREATSAKSAETKAKRRLLRAGVPKEALDNATITTTTKKDPWRSR